MNAVLKEKFEIQHERYSERLCEELLPLLKQNWEASASYKADITLKPDWPRYKKMDDMGMVLCLTARDEGRLVGYAIWFIVSSFNYESLKVAHGTAWYMAQGYKGHGVKLLRRGERMLIEHGIRRFYWFVSPGSPLQELLKAFGYEPDELIMEKTIVSSN